MEKYGRDGQVTDNIIRRMRITSWISKDTNTHSEYVIPTAFSTASMVSRALPIVTLQGLDLTLKLCCCFFFLRKFSNCKDLSALGIGLRDIRSGDRICKRQDLKCRLLAWGVVYCLGVTLLV